MTSTPEQVQVVYDDMRGVHAATLMATGRVLPDLSIPRNNVPETSMPPTSTDTAAELFARAQKDPGGTLRILGPWVPDGTGEFGCGWKPLRMRCDPRGKGQAFSGLMDGEPAWSTQEHSDALGTEADCDAWLREQGFILVGDPGPAPVPSVLDEVAAELVRARSIHGIQHDLPSFEENLDWWGPGYSLEHMARRSLARAPNWAAVLAEEVGEALQADGADLRAELVQVAAMAVAWIEVLDAKALQIRRAKGVSDV